MLALEEQLLTLLTFSLDWLPEILVFNLVQTPFVHICTLLFLY